MASQRKMIGFRHLLRLMLIPHPLEPKEYTKPTSQKEYEETLQQEGFVVPSKWANKDAEKWQSVDITQHPDVIADLAVLEEYLLPVFWNFNQKAKHYQRHFYYYHRIFLIAALITTLISVVNSFVLASDATITTNLDAMSNNFFFRPISNFNFAANLTTFLGVLTALISARASYYTLLSNYGSPRQKWGRYRRLTEELRILYFKYLAHLGNFKGEDRVYALRDAVLKLRLQEQADG